MESLIVYKQYDLLQCTCLLFLECTQIRIQSARTYILRFRFTQITFIIDDNRFARFLDQLLGQTLWRYIVDILANDKGISHRIKCAASQSASGGAVSIRKSPLIKDHSKAYAIIYLCSIILTEFSLRLLPNILADVSRPSNTVEKPSTAPAAIVMAPSIALLA